MIMLKKNGGITLIALVITIIVLLILAGVSIAMISGENGILNRASASSVQNQLGSLNDAVSLFVTEKVADYYEDAYVSGNTSVSGITLDEYLDKKVTADTLTAKGTGVEGLSSAENSESSTTAKVTLDTTAKKLESITLTMKDSKYTYTSTGSVANGKVSWKITK